MARTVAYIFAIAPTERTNSDPDIRRGRNF